MDGSGVFNLLALLNGLSSSSSNANIADFRGTWGNDIIDDDRDDDDDDDDGVDDDAI